MKLKLYNVINLLIIILFIKYLFIFLISGGSAEGAGVVASPEAGGAFIKMMLLFFIYGINNTYKLYIKIDIKKD